MTNASLTDVLKRSFSLSHFRKGQEDIISSVLQGKDVLAVLPTGGGKSLCYQFPAVMQSKLVVVISPLIALMRDQVSSLKRMKIPAGCLYSGQSEEEKKQIFQDMQTGGTYVLYLSPERVQKDGFKKWIMDKPIALFAVDEAHCVSQWGHDFRAEYTQLNILKTLRPDVPVLALTASATPNVLHDISKCLNLKNAERKVHGFYRPNLYYQVEVCQNNEEKLALLKAALKKFPEGRKLIYCGTRKIAEELASVLAMDFDEVAFYHAGMPANVRHQTQEDYITGKTKILVATNAFGMGIDQPDVRLVVHFQLPANIDSLYQEMGRAGRDGLDSTCLLIYAKADKGLQSYFLFNSDAPKAIKDSRWRNLEALVNYSEGSECRHAEILTYFKDAQRIQSCGHCDVCDPSSNRRIEKPISEKVVIPKTATTLGKSKTVKKKTEKSPLILDPEQEKLFLHLKKWRKEKATELDLPAFVIFSDQTLRHMAAIRPRLRSDLLLVSGVGEAKLEKFGDELMQHINSFEN